MPLHNDSEELPLPSEQQSLQQYILHGAVLDDNHHRRSDTIVSSRQSVEVMINFIFNFINLFLMWNSHYCSYYTGHQGYLLEFLLTSS